MAWAPDYVTLAVQRKFVGIADPNDTADDSDIADAITAASRAIDDHCNRQFGKVAAPEARRYTAWPNYERGVWVVDIDDLDDVTGFVVTIDSVAVTTYTLEPVNAVVKGKVWERLVIDPATSSVLPTGVANEIAATASWGWSTTPVPVRNASKLQGSRFFIRRQSPYGIAGSPDSGSEMRLLSRVDPDVGVSLRRYRRTRRVG
jgi:hypothetical protein